MSSPPGRGVRDGIVAVLLFAAVVTYLSLLPRNLGYTDESFFLYEAKRIRDGDVMYRDFFQFITPLSSYVMAGLFVLFGTTMATARISMAVLHGTTGVLLYATARRLGVRRTFAALVVLAYLSLCQAAWPYASWHWYSTLLFAALLLVTIAAPWAQRPRWAALPGVVSGIMIGVQQQKGVFIAAGVCLVFTLDHLVGRRYSREPWRPLAMRLAWFAAGVAVVVVPLLGLFVFLAGPEPLYAALVRFPLENYRAKLQVGWGRMGPLGANYAEYTFPSILRYSPAALALPVLACLRALWSASDRRRVRQLIALTVLSACSAMSIWYYPDTIHIAFIAAGFWLCVAVGVEWVLSGVRAEWVARLAAALVAVGVTARLGLHLIGYVGQLREAFPISHETAFGRVDFAAPWQPALVDDVRGVLAASPGTDIFYYPPIVGMYLVTGGRNPIPYQFLVPGVSPEEHTRQTLAILRGGKVPYVFLARGFARADDPIAQFITENYESVSVPEIRPNGGRTRFTLLARKDRAQPDALAGS